VVAGRADRIDPPQLIAVRAIVKSSVVVCASIAAALLMLELGVRLVYAARPGVKPQEQLSRADSTMPPIKGLEPCRIREGTGQGALVRAVFPR